MPQSGKGSVTYFILELKIVQATGQQLSHLSPSRSPLWSLFIPREGAPAQEEAGGRKRYAKPHINPTLAMKRHQVRSQSGNTPQAATGGLGMLSIPGFSAQVLTTCQPARASFRHQGPPD